MPHSAVAVANYFIEKAKESGDKLTPLKLQKLIYFAHGWHLALNNSPLIDEQVQAWKFGPVIPSIYHAFKQFGNEPITSRASDIDLDGDLKGFFPQIPNDSSSKPLLDRIWEVYKKYSGVQLSNATHQPNTPWHGVAVKEGLEKKYVGIPDDDIKAFFVKKSQAKKEG